MFNVRRHVRPQKNLKSVVTFFSLVVNHILGHHPSCLKRLLKELNNMDQSLPTDARCPIWVRFDEESPQYLAATKFCSSDSQKDITLSVFVKSFCRLSDYVGGNYLTTHFIIFNTKISDSLLCVHHLLIAGCSRTGPAEAAETRPSTPTSATWRTAGPRLSFQLGTPNGPARSLSIRSLDEDLLSTAWGAHENADPNHLRVSLLLSNSAF